MKILSDNPPENSQGYFKVHKLTLQNKKNRQVVREYLNSKDAACAIVFDTVRNKYLFVKQFRPGPKIPLIEACAGMLDHSSEDSLETMKREIVEELGYQVDTINLLIKPYYTSPGKTNEKMITYFATVSKKIAQGGGLESENEEIDIVELTKEEVRKTEFMDGKTLLALCVLKLK
jgi:ADP-ribose pyrophosphatase